MAAVCLRRRVELNPQRTLCSSDVPGSMSSDTQISAKLQAQHVCHDPSQHPPEPKILSQPASDFICDKCSAVDWDQLPKVADDSDRKKPVWTMVMASLDSSSAELGASPCKVCRLLSCIKPPIYDGHHCILYAYSGMWGYTQLRVISEELHGLSKRRNLDSISYDEEFPSLTVIGPGDYRDLNSMKKLSSHVDPTHYDALTSILRNCRRNHKNTCKYVKRAPDIPSLQVIDCESREVVQAPPQCKYLALSYVWGKVKHSENLDDPPPVIADTFVVCARLGLKYLWIDQYASTFLASFTSAVQHLGRDKAN